MLRTPILLKVFTSLAFLLFFQCKKDPAPVPAEPALQFKLHFDPNQVRLNNLGQISSIPAGHAAQTPEFREMSIHYIELSPSPLTQLGAGAVVYHAAETAKGGENAVDFDLAAKGPEGAIIAKVNLRDVAPGAYKYIRASVTYQNFDITYNINNIPVIGTLTGQKGTLASFVGFNTYLGSFQVREKSLTVNDDKKQGFWAFESNLSAPYSAYNQLTSGQAPAGATTVVNPLFATSEVPAGSCVVTGQFAEPLVITGKETADITVTLSFSINKSFEWVDANGNGKLDFSADGSTAPEQVTDMGLRGLVPSW